MKRLLLFLLVVGGLSLAGGCARPGYYHTHPCVGPDGVLRTVRHWHAKTGFAGYHPHPFPNDVHQSMMMSGQTVTADEEDEEKKKK